MATAPGSITLYTRAFQGVRDDLYFDSRSCAVVVRSLSYASRTVSQMVVGSFSSNCSNRWRYAADFFLNGMLYFQNTILSQEDPEFAMPSSVSHSPHDRKAPRLPGGFQKLP